MKYFRFSEEDVLFKMSYVNVLMYLATIPDASIKKDKTEDNETPVSVSTADVKDWFQL